MPMISGQIPQELMEEFDKLQKRMGFSSRSEALRESIQFFIHEHIENIPTEGYKIATVSVHFAPHEDTLTNFSQLVHQYDNIVKSIHQYNLKNRIVKTIILAGPATDIFEFYNALAGDRHYSALINYLIIPEEETSE